MNIGNIQETAEILIKAFTLDVNKVTIHLVTEFLLSVKEPRNRIRLPTCTCTCTRPVRQPYSYSVPKLPQVVLKFHL